MVTTFKQFLTSFTLKNQSVMQPLIKVNALSEKQIVPKRLVTWTPEKKWVNDDQAFLLVQGPRSLIMHWEIQKASMDIVGLHLGVSWNQVYKQLRLHDVTDMMYNGTYSHRHVDVLLPEMTNNWIFNHLDSERSYLAEYGVGAKENHFIPLLRTNAVITPASTNWTDPTTHSLAWKQISSTDYEWKNHFSSYTYYE
ncbi:DUF4912 domain-containing protein [Alkalicoccobacillus porphyridii]|nr:DUF4912 domain-containing protein [Alkalicoccobacillus porphyridii]